MAAENTMPLVAARPLVTRVVHITEDGVAVYLPVRLADAGTVSEVRGCSVDPLGGVDRNVRIARYPRDLTGEWQNVVLEIDACEEGTSLHEVSLRCAWDGQETSMELGFVQLTVEPLRQQAAMLVHHAMRTVVLGSENDNEWLSGDRWEVFGDECVKLKDSVIPGEEAIEVNLRVRLEDGTTGSPRVSRLEVVDGSAPQLNITDARLIDRRDNEEVWQARIAVPDGLAPQDGQAVLRITSRRPDVASALLRIGFTPGQYARLATVAKSATLKGDAYLGHVLNDSRRVLRLSLKNTGTIGLQYKISGGEAVETECTARVASGKTREVRVPFLFSDKYEGGDEIELVVQWRPLGGGRWRREERTCRVTLRDDLRYCSGSDRVRILILDMLAPLVLAGFLVAVWRIAFADWGTHWLPFVFEGSFNCFVPQVLIIWLVVAGFLQECHVLLLTLSRRQTIGMKLANAHMIETRYGLDLTGAASWRDLPQGSYDYKRKFVRWLPLRMMARVLVQAGLAGGLLSVLSVPFTRERASLHDLATGTRLVIQQTHKRQQGGIEL